jgi:uncharacterized protein
MKLVGSRSIKAGRSEVWDALNDATVLRQCIPGCEELTGNPESGFEAVAVQKIGPVKARFKGKVILSNIIPMESYTIAGEGQGGIAGFAKGSADVQLGDGDGVIELTYAVHASVGGKMAQLGSRLIDAFAARMADEFFKRFVAIVEDNSDLPRQVESQIPN